MNDNTPKGEKDTKLSEKPEGDKKQNPKAHKQRGKTFAGRGVEKRG